MAFSIYNFYNYIYWYIFPIKKLHLALNYRYTFFNTGICTTTAVNTKTNSVSIALIHILLWKKGTRIRIEFPIPDRPIKWLIHKIVKDIMPHQHRETRIGLIWDGKWERNEHKKYIASVPPILPSISKGKHPYIMDAISMWEKTIATGHKSRQAIINHLGNAWWLKNHPVAKNNTEDNPCMMLQGTILNHLCMTIVNIESINAKATALSPNLDNESQVSFPQNKASKKVEIKVKI